MKLFVATTNKGKIKEIRTLLEDLDVEILTPSEFPTYTPAIEDGSSFAENALKKARHAHSLTGLTSLADDSGLEVDLLGKAPGIRSARYAGEDATDYANNEKILAQLAKIRADSRLARAARFRCALALVTADGEEVFEGSLEGSIAKKPSGNEGFGYDPIFIPAPEDKYGEKTLAELGQKIKDKISHRAIALKKLRRRLAGNIHGVD